MTFKFESTLNLCTTYRQLGYCKCQCDMHHQCALDSQSVIKAVDDVEGSGNGTYVAMFGEVKQLLVLENEGLHIAEYSKELVIDDMDVQDEIEASRESMNIL